MRLNPSAKFELEWRRYQRKDGKLGHWYSAQGPYYTPLNQCDLCGIWSTPKRVHHRNDCYIDIDGLNWGTPMLCTSCWNRVRPIVRQYDLIRECQRLVRKLRRVASERASHNRNTA